MHCQNESNEIWRKDWIRDQQNIYKQIESVIIMGKRDDKNQRKICLHCSKYISLKNDHHVQLHTLNRQTKPDDHAYFHFQCWVDYFNIKVENKMKANIKFMQERAVQVFEHPIIKGLLSQVQGSEIAMNMLKHGIQTDVLVSGERVKKQIQNDRKKRSAKKRKAKMQ